MNISAPFIKRPIATTLLSIGIALVGMLAFYLLPVSSLPQIEFPTIVVQASLSGSSPEVMATSVATPIERQLTKIAGITEMTSSSTLGSTKIVVQFDLSRSIDSAARDVQAALSASLADLPSNMPSRPTYRKVNPADSPILILALTSDTYPVSEIYDYASTELQQSIMQLNGVGQVIVGGSSLPAVRVEANPTKLNKYGLSMSDLASTIKSANTNSAKGQIISRDQTSEITMNDQISKASDYGKLIVSYKNGNALKLEDVAEVTDSVQDIRNGGSFNNKPTVAIIIFKEPGANVIEAVDRVINSMPTLKSLIPADIKMQVVMDRTTVIRASLVDVEKTLIASVFLVILVIYLFLGNLRATIVPSIAMTLSLLGTFFVMKYLGFSLNNLSLMALTVATGFVVDDAIVVLENITRYVEKGMKPFDAALKGSAEIGFTVTSMSLSLIAVFIPILCMGGIVGRLFREFAVTLSVSIFISLIISLTLTPVMCSKFIRHLHPNENVNTIKKLYESSLRKVLLYKHLTLISLFVIMFLSIALYIYVPKGFFPQQDTGRIMGTIVTDQDSSFQALKSKFEKFIKLVKENNDVKDVVGFIGSGSTNSGSIFITLNSKGERKKTIDEVINDLRKHISKIPGATVYMQAAQDIVIGGRQGNAQFQFSVSGDSTEEVNQYAPIIMKHISAIPEIIDVNSDQRDHGLETYVKVNYEIAASLGVTVAEVDRTLYASFGQSTQSTIYSDLNQYYVVLEVAEKYWQNPESLNTIYVKSSSGELVPLSAFAEFSTSYTLLSTNHQSLAPVATISFNLLANNSLGNIVDLVQNSMKELKLPSTIQTEFKGTAQAFKLSLKNEPILILTSIIVVYIVLGMLYESLIHPVTIISTIPSAGVGALIALIVTRTDLTVIAIIGIILLIGIVKKNAIMMIDFVLEIKKRENISSEEAIIQAAVLRFRPIMMTTMCALLGSVPLAFGTGVGAEIRTPLGITIIGGLIFSQMLTLYTTPVTYLYMEKLGDYFKKGTKNAV